MKRIDSIIRPHQLEDVSSFQKYKSPFWLLTTCSLRSLKRSPKERGPEKIGDGKIFITALEKVIRIRTGDRGEAAL